MFLIRSLIFFLPALIACSVARGVPTCIQLKDAWDTRFSREFQTSWNNLDFGCNSDHRQYKMALALYDLNREFLKSNDDGTKAQLFAKVKAGTKVLREMNDKEEKAGDCNGTFAFYRDGELIFCPIFFGSSREIRAMTVIHEARHGASEDKGHVACVSGPYKQTKNFTALACDKKFYDGAWNGSGYNAEVYFLSWNIQRRSQLNTLSQSILKSELREVIPNHFVEISPQEVKEWRR